MAMTPEHRAKLTAARQSFWDRVRKGEIPHPTKGKRRPDTAVRNRNGAKQQQSHPSSPETRRPHRRTQLPILDRIKVATLQLVEIDAMPIKDIEDTFNSVDECERGLLILDQLLVRVQRMHVLVSYCRELHQATLQRIRAHEKNSIPH